MPAQVVSAPHLTMSFDGDSFVLPDLMRHLSAESYLYHLSFAIMACSSYLSRARAHHPDRASTTEAEACTLRRRRFCLLRLGCGRRLAPSENFTRLAGCAAAAGSLEAAG